MRLTIERLRTLILAAGVLLVVAIAVFLAIGKWKSPFSRKDLPSRLAGNIQQDFSGLTYTQAHGGHTLFKIHASKVVQLKEGKALLHDVQIELYGEDGSRVDRIEGSEFEYDTKAGIARAAGPVEITLTRPGVAPAIAPKATPSHALEDKQHPLAAAARTAASGEVHVETSGLVFNQNSGVATTDERVEFRLAQGSGSAVGALYKAEEGHLVLNRAVQLKMQRGGQPMELLAEHAVFERGDQICRLSAARASYPGGTAQAQEATILFRDDGSAQQLDATNGIQLQTAAGGRMTAPEGTLAFDVHNQPQKGLLSGGVTMDSDANGQKLHGAAPTMQLQFSSDGVLRQAHLERGVQISSEEQGTAGGVQTWARRTWQSPLADLEFRSAGRGHVELASIHGTGGVVVTGESRRGNGPVMPSRMSADEVTGTFGAGSELTAITGTGHASMEETTSAGSRQTMSGDRLVANFAPAAGRTAGSKPTGSRPKGAEGSAQIQSAMVQGNVVLVQQPAARAGQPAPAAMHATAQRADYEGAGVWLHLIGNPRVEDGGLQLAADKVDVSQASGDAFARGNVKATWLGEQNGNEAPRRSTPASEHMADLGGQGPAHAIAAQAELRQSSGEVIFQGQARLWQQANSIAAPVIVLNRPRQTLVASTASAADPVRVVLVSATAPAPQRPGRPEVPSVVRMHGGELKYSAAERKAVMRAGVTGGVTAETTDSTTVSNQVELTLLPPGNHAGRNGAAAEVDTMTASGHVQVSSQGRRGTGEKLVYSNDSGEFVLTGTAAAPPRLIDPAKGTVTGQALIFNSHDDSVRVEGDGRKTVTETTAPR